MENNFVLLQNTDTKNEQSHKPLQLKLDLSTPSRNEIDVTRCPTVYEDGHYNLQLQIKLSGLEQALAEALNTKQRQDKLFKSSSAQLSGADLARQDLHIDNSSKIVEASQEHTSAEYDCETESLFLTHPTNKDVIGQPKQPKVLYLQSKLGKRYSGMQWRSQGIALANNGNQSSIDLNTASNRNRTSMARAWNSKTTYADLNDMNRDSYEDYKDEQATETDYENDDNDVFKLIDDSDSTNVSSLRLFDDQFKRLTSISIDLNQQRIGQCSIENQGSGNYLANAVFEQRNGVASSQPFLLHYDVLVLSFNLFFEDGYSLTLYAPPLLCASLNSHEALNINQILFELTNLENNRLLDLMFKRGQQSARQVTKDDWMNFEENRSYQSLSDYIYLVEQIIYCYTNNFSYFKTQAKHSLTKWQQVVPFSQVKQVSSKNFNWLTQHLEELTQVDSSNAIIRYQDKSYQPLHMQTENMRKSYATYENKVVIGFLHLVLHNANKIANEYQQFITQQREQLNQGTQLSHGSYQAPIITMKLIQLEHCEQELNKMHAVLGKLSNLYLNYQSIFKIPPTFLKTFPRKSKIFQELKPYAEVFMSIWYFFQFGSFHLDKDRMLFEVTTLDRLFEYYCLYRLLEMLVQKGFKPIPNGNQIFDYTIFKSLNVQHAQGEVVANTYVLRRGQQQVVLYYQPVIYSKCFENGIKAYRTTQSRFPKSLQCGDFYTPDFIMRFRNSPDERYQEDYIIFDAKFAQTNTILKYYIHDLTRKYGFETAIAMVEPHQKSLHEEQLERSYDLNEQASANGETQSEFEGNTHQYEQPSAGRLINRESKREYDFVGSKPPKMIFALQGRINFSGDNKQQSFAASTATTRQPYRQGDSRHQYNGVRMHTLRNMMLMHNSDIARQCPPPTTIGLVEFNTQINSTPALWSEIVRNLPYLAQDPRSEKEKQDDAEIQAQGKNNKLSLRNSENYNGNEEMVAG